MSEPGVVSEPRVLTIDRSKWRRGGDAPDIVNQYGSTAMLTDKGYMCCLGFDAIAYGVHESVLAGRGYPDDCASKEVPTAYYAHVHDNDAEHHIAAAIAANDDTGISEIQRESRVRVALIQLGWDDVVFIN